MRYISGIIQEVDNVLKGRHHSPMMFELLQVFFAVGLRLPWKSYNYFFKVVCVHFSYTVHSF